MSTVAICVLLVLSATGELFGTLTVWATYRRGARLAGEFRAQMSAEEKQLEALGSARRLMPHE